MVKKKKKVIDGQPWIHVAYCSCTFLVFYIPPVNNKIKYLSKLRWRGKSDQKTDQEVKCPIDILIYGALNLMEV